MSRTLKRYTGLFALILMALAVMRCAHPVMPEGGPRDVTPPMIVKAEPEIYSTYFESRRVEVTFNEFIQLKDPQKEIFISPPMEENPEFKVRGKSLIIDFPGELKENTTYSIFFGNSIVDLTESNPKSNFEYVFSTGSSIDSLNITGNVLNAMDLKPVPNVLVMLYLDNNDTVTFDSMPLLVRPVSASKSLEDGSYRLNNLRGGEYKIFALEDKNSNFIYDLPNERIAFLDSLVSPVFLPRMPADSMLSDSLAMLEYQAMVDASSQDITLHLFQEPDTSQRLLEARVESQVLVRFVFKAPTSDVHLDITGSDMGDDEWCMRESNKKGDTLHCWIVNTMPDTVYVEVSDSGEILDTVRLIMRKPEPERNTRRGKEEKEERLKVSTNLSAGKLELNKELVLTFQRPVVEWDSIGYLLVEAEDTLEAYMEFIDPLQRKGIIIHPWKEETDYRLVIPDSVFTGLGGLVNDSVRLSFATRARTDYGHIFLEIDPQGPDDAYIIQLLSSKEQLLRERIARGDEILEFTYLLPDVYILKAIRDENDNGEWDAGNYLDGKLPEKVYYFPVTLDIRANWELQEAWSLP